MPVRSANRVHVHGLTASIVEEDTPEDIFEHPQSERLQDFLSKVL